MDLRALRAAVGLCYSAVPRLRASSAAPPEGPSKRFSRAEGRPALSARRRGRAGGREQRRGCSLGSRLILDRARARGRGLLHQPPLDASGAHRLESVCNRTKPYIVPQAAKIRHSSVLPAFYVAVLCPSAHAAQRPLAHRAFLSIIRIFRGNCCDGRTSMSYDTLKYRRVLTPKIPTFRCLCGAGACSCKRALYSITPTRVSG